MDVEVCGCLKDCCWWCNGGVVIYEGSFMVVIKVVEERGESGWVRNLSGPIVWELVRGRGKICEAELKFCKRVMKKNEKNLRANSLSPQRIFFIYF